MGQFQSTMKTELKSVQDFVASSSTNVPLSAQRIVNVVEKSVMTEDRSKNVILYDVSEDDSDDVEKSVWETPTRILYVTGK